MSCPKQGLLRNVGGATRIVEAKKTTISSKYTSHNFAKSFMRAGSQFSVRFMALAMFSARRTNSG
jgi:hypothetical protein